MESFETGKIFPPLEQISLRYLKVRCPQCYKLYSVDVEEIKTHDKSKFECNSCHKRFWISCPECFEQKEIVGFPLEWLPSAKESTLDKESLKLFNCPKCTQPYATGENQCKSCGVVFEKYNFRDSEKESTIFASSELKSSWEKVLESYDNKKLHHQFLVECQAEDNLKYAASKYAVMLEVNPQDVLANAMQKEIIALASVPAITVKSKSLRTKPRIRPSSFILILCGILIGVGYSIPSLRNLVGVGAALIFVVLSLRYYFK